MVMMRGLGLLLFSLILPLECLPERLKNCLSRIKVRN